MTYADHSSGPITEKPSSALFKLDTAGSQSIRNNFGKLLKPLKADEILARRSAVPVVSSRKRASARTTDGILEPASKKHRNRWVSKQEVQRLRRSLNDRNHLASQALVNDEDGTFDLWSGDRQTKDHAQYDDLDRHKAKVMPPTLRRAPVAMTASGKSVPAVKIPSGCASYNPAFNDWDELLQQNAEKVVEAEKKRLKTNEAEVEQEARIAAIQHENEQKTSLDQESAWEGFESEDNRPESLRKKQPERKTTAQRNRIRRRKAAEQQALHESKMADKKLQARQLEEVMQKSRQVGSITITPRRSTLAEDTSSAKEEEEDSSLRRRPMRNVRIPEKPLELVLPDELQDSLCRLKPEGSLLDDRFRNLLINGKLEARKPIWQPKKRKVTYTEKWTHKDFRIAT